MLENIIQILLVFQFYKLCQTATGLMGTCQCFRPQEKKTYNNYQQPQPPVSQNNPGLQLSFQQKKVVIELSTKQNLDNVSINLFRTFADWDSRKSYVKTRSAQQQWERERLAALRLGENQISSSELRKRKDSVLTADSMKKIDIKLKM